MTHIRRVLIVASFGTFGFFGPFDAFDKAQPARTASEEAYRQNNLGVAHLERYDFKSAVAAFRGALQIDPKLAMARLNLAIALLHAGQPEAATPEARVAAQALPQTPHAHYIVGLVARADNRAAEAMAAFRRVLDIDPADVGSRVQLAQVLLAEQKYPEAIRLFEEAVRMEPFNATATYGLGTALTRAGEREKGAEALKRFEQLRGNPAAITYSSAYLEQGRYSEAMASTGAEPELVDPSIPQVSFADATVDVLGSAPEARGMALFDADHDGDLDLALVASGRLRFLRNVRGRLRPQAADLKVADEGITAAVAGDYDNDSRPDLFLLSTGGGRLLRQQANGTWRDVTSGVNLPPLRSSTTAAWADVDHDGDLDIITGAPELARNNGNGSFGDFTADARLSSAPSAIAIVPTDYDNRRDIDLLFVPSEGAPALFSNARDGTFRNVAGEARLSSRDRYRAAAAGDVNKDGFTDFFLARTGAVGRFAISDGAGRFTVVDGPRQTIDATAAQFIDYDNDGILDLFVLTPTGPGVWRQTSARWIDVTARALPAALQVADDFAGLKSRATEERGSPSVARDFSPAIPSPADPAGLADPAVALNAGDIDGDGDTDVIVRLASGRVRVWRNDGGSRHASLSVRLAPRVSNRSALGAKVDLRAGSLRQRIETTATTPPATPADLVFGLGSRARADVVRVLWPAGILQAETTLGSARAGATSQIATISELNRKPSSCPFLYTWNGSRFEFVSDFMGGGEMGAWAGPGVWNAPDPDEYVRIRGDQLRPRNGRYEVRVTSELEEAVFIDRLYLVAVSHPIGVDIYPNEGLRSPAERRPFALTTVQRPRPPHRVVDHHAHDVLDRVKALDRRFVDDFRLDAIQGYAEKHWVEIDLGLKPVTGSALDIPAEPAPGRQFLLARSARLGPLYGSDQRAQPGQNPGKEPYSGPNDSRAVLLLTGWTDYAFSSDNVAAHQAGLQFHLPSLEVKNAAGNWVTAVAEIGLPVGRPQTVVVDLSPLVARGVREVRIVTTLRVYWDQILVDSSAPVPFSQKNVEAAAAMLEWRGFSAESSPDGKEPWSYDYSRVSASAPWKLMPGRYTREGDVRPLLSAIDDRFVIGAPGDEIALSFDATDVPRPPAGWTTTFLLFVDGFSKEMNLHSGSPDQVEPLPFHAMSGYPYPASERYPDSVEHQEYRATYNRRVIGRQLPPLEIVNTSRD